MMRYDLRNLVPAIVQNGESEPAMHKVTESNGLLLLLFELIL